MDLADLIVPEGVVPALKVKNKKQAFQEMARRAAAITGLDPATIFEALFQREQLAPTGYGRGIAIPHGRIAGLPRVIALFARLDEPIPFDAIDGEPVDLLFVLLAPEHAGADHLKALARVSRLVRDPDSIAKLRSSTDRRALHAVLTEPLASHAA
jgi:PTS system nitrogen regulatory IIA component